MHQSPISVRFLLPIAAGLLLYGAAASAQAAPSGGGTGAPPPMARRADRCSDIPARAAARLAYLQTKLALNATQTPLFTRWKDVKLTAARQMQARCDTYRKNGGPTQTADSKGPSPVDRLARTQERLQQRLADIRAERPALSALYASLSDTQKATFGHDGMRGMHRAGMMRHIHSQMHGPMHPMRAHPAPDRTSAPAPAPAP